MKVRIAILCVLRVLQSSESGRDFHQIHAISNVPTLSLGNYVTRPESRFKSMIVEDGGGVTDDGGPTSTSNRHVRGSRGGPSGLPVERLQGGGGRRAERRREEGVAGLVRALTAHKGCGAELELLARSLDVAFGRMLRCRVRYLTAALISVRRSICAALRFTDGI